MGVVAVVPALDEAASIGGVVSDLLRYGIGHVIVVDNGSTDATAAVARAAGANVVEASPRGYGAACQAGIAALPAHTIAVLFCDGDGADQLMRIDDVVRPVLRGEADLVIGSRTLGGAVAGALTWPQRTGNFIAARLLRMLFRERVTDLGPFRCISVSALRELDMRDLAFGWTAEMQTKAFRQGHRVLETPVTAQLRRGGRSKISGQLVPVIRAGWAILSTIVRYRVAPRRIVSGGR
ncbi:MAG: glycosyltransferase family 2 protein [Kofleriaceae bacterium]